MSCGCEPGNEAQHLENRDSPRRTPSDGSDRGAGWAHSPGAGSGQTSGARFAREEFLEQPAFAATRSARSPRRITEIRRARSTGTKAPIRRSARPRARTLEGMQELRRLVAGALDHTDAQVGPPAAIGACRASRADARDSRLHAARVPPRSILRLERAVEGIDRSTTALPPGRCREHPSRLAHVTARRVRQNVSDRQRGSAR